MSGLPEGANWLRISGTAAGSAVIKAEQTTLYGVLLGQNKTGTVTFYDSPTGTVARQLTPIDNTVGTAPSFIPVFGKMKKGLYYVSGGTTDMTVFFE